MNPADQYAASSRFALKLGRWDFVYREANKTLTIPVEMLMQGDYLWELSRSSIKSWDAPSKEIINSEDKERILNQIIRYVELTNKKVRVT
jgi:hypothetical protein